MSTKANIIIEQGATFSLDIELVDAAEEALDVTGFTATSKLRKNYDSANSYSFTTTLTTGNLNIAMTAANTALIAAGRYVYDVKMGYGDGIKSRVLEGIATVKAEVTK